LDIALAISLRPSDAPLAARKNLAELDGDDVLLALSRALAMLGSVRIWDTTRLGPAAIAAEPAPDLIFNVSEGLAEPTPRRRPIEPRAAPPEKSAPLTRD